MKLIRCCAVAAALLGAVAGTQARDVHWSIGIHAYPGVGVTLGNARPVYVAPAPMYVAPPPVYVAPPPVYVAPAPIYYYPAATAAYAGPPVVYVKPRHHWRPRPHRPYRYSY